MTFSDKRSFYLEIDKRLPYEHPKDFYMWLNMQTQFDYQIDVEGDPPSVGRYFYRFFKRDDNSDNWFVTVQYPEGTGKELSLSNNTYHSSRTAKYRVYSTLNMVSST